MVTQLEKDVTVCDLGSERISRREMLQAVLAGAGVAAGAGALFRASGGVAQAQSAGANAVALWADTALQAVRDTRLGPPMVARALAITHTCIYDAWAAYDPVAVGTRLIRGEDWQPYQAPTVVTPAFPEYVSGHSGFSAACAEVLKRFTGSDAFGASHTQRAGSSLFEPGTTPAADVTLSWRTFTEAANQAGLSRRYGGIHFPDGDLMGRAIGRRVGVEVWRKVQMYFSGKAY